MRIKLICIFALLALQAKTQDFANRKYNFANADSFIISDSDQKLDAIILQDDRIKEYYKNENGDLQFNTLVHKVIWVNEEKAIEEFNKIYIPSYNTIKMVKFKARTIQPDKSIKIIDKENIKELPNVEDKGAYKIVALDGVVKGSIIEYIYVAQEDVEYFGKEIYQTDLPVRAATFKLLYPDVFKFQVKCYNNCPEIMQDNSSDQVEVNIIFNNLPALYEEQYAYYTTYLTRVEYKFDEVKSKGKIFTWQDASDLITDKTYIFSSKANGLAKSFLKPLALKSKTDLDKIIAIEKLVKEKIQLQDANGEDFEVPEKIFKSKFANESGFKNLFALLLSIAKVDHQLVITSDRSKVMLDPDFSTYNSLQNYLYYFPSLKKFMDPSNFAMRLGTIPIEDLNNNGLFLTYNNDPKNPHTSYKIKQIPNVELKDHSDDMFVSITFPKDMTVAQLAVKRTMGGYTSVGIQPFWGLMEEKDKKTFVEDLLKNSGNDAEILTKKTSNTAIDDIYANKNFTVEGTMDIESLLEKAGKKYILNLGDVIGAQVEMYQDKTRQLDIDMDFPHQYLREINITIPDGYQAKGLEDININHVFNNQKGEPAYGFTSSYTLENNIIHLVCKEFYNIVNLPKTEIDKFRTVINSAADFNKIKIILEQK